MLVHGVDASWPTGMLFTHMSGFRSEQIAIRPRKVYQKFDFAAGVLRSEALPVNNRVVHPDVPQKTELLQGQVPSPAADDLFW